MMTSFDCEFATVGKQFSSIISSFSQVNSSASSFSFVSSSRFSVFTDFSFVISFLLTLHLIRQCWFLSLPHSWFSHFSLRHTSDFGVSISLLFLFCLLHILGAFVSVFLHILVMFPVVICHTFGVWFSNNFSSLLSVSSVCESDPFLPGESRISPEGGSHIGFPMLATLAVVRSNKVGWLQLEELNVNSLMGKTDFQKFAPTSSGSC
jgi:hypothetical protein